MCSIFSVHGTVSPRSTQHSLHASFYSNAFPPVQLSSHLTATNVQANQTQRPTKTRRFLTEIKLRRLSSCPQNPSFDNNDLSSRCAAVLCFVLQVLILQAFHTLHPALSQAHSAEHYDSVQLLLYVLSISTLTKDNWSKCKKSIDLNERETWRIKLPPRFDSKPNSLISPIHFPAGSGSFYH